MVDPVVRAVIPKSLSGSLVQDLGNRYAGHVPGRHRQGWDGPGTSGCSPPGRAPPAGVHWRKAPGESLFQVNFAATAAEAGNPLGLHGSHYPVTVPPRTKAFGPQERVIFVVGMKDFGRRRGDSQGGQPTKSRGQLRGIPPPDHHPSGKLIEHDPTDRRLHLSHAPVGAEAVMQPAEPGRLRLPVDRPGSSCHGP